jgi:hypothetical protein
MAALCPAMETKDIYTRGHRERVSRGAVMIGREIGMRASRVEAILYAGMLHDVGKLGVPTTVLRKDGPLTRRSSRPSRCTPCAAWRSSRRSDSWARPWLGSCTGLAPDFPNNCSGVFQLPSGDIIAQFVTAPGPGAKRSNLRASAYHAGGRGHRLGGGQMMRHATRGRSVYESNGVPAAVRGHDQRLGSA